MKQREHFIRGTISVASSVGLLSHTKKVREEKEADCPGKPGRNLLNEPTTAGGHPETDSYHGWPLDLLCLYLIQQHHMYIDKQAPLIQRYLSRTRKTNQHNFPELVQVEELFSECVFKLKETMKQKEMILFPRIIQMGDEIREMETFVRPAYGSIGVPIATIKSEQKVAIELFRQLKQLSPNLRKVPVDCNDYRLAFGLLDEFERSLFLQTNIENMVIFPKALAMEKTRCRMPNGY